MIDANTITDGIWHYTRRFDSGYEAIATAGQVEDEEELETLASDAISNILTYLFGPAGVTYYDGDTYRLSYDEDTIAKARALLDRALTSYKGDAEDYTVECKQPDLDFEHLVTLWERHLQTTDPYVRGYQAGRVKEYAAQNALSDAVQYRARIEASKRVYGPGPERGLQS